MCCFMSCVVLSANIPDDWPLPTVVAESAVARLGASSDGSNSDSDDDEVVEVAKKKHKAGHRKVR
jgi:hypothetical protein